MSNLRLPDLLNADPLEDAFRNWLRPLRMDIASQAPQIKLDLSEDEQNYTVKAEIPGVRKEDIEVQIDGAQVSLRAEVKKEKQEKDGERVLRSERSYGFASRSFTLGTEVDQAKTTAAYKDGVLTLTMPKKSGTSAKRVTIT